MKIRVLQIMVLTVTLIEQISAIPPTPPVDEEEHTNNRLKHYIKRFDILAKNIKSNFLPDLQKLKATFETSLAKDSTKEKLQLLETYSKKLNKEFAIYLEDELDKQYINEEILIHRWYVQEILPDLNEHLAKEAKKFLDKIDEAHKIQDFDEKFELYAKASESISEDLWEYVNEIPEPLPVLKAHLKFFQEYIGYLLQECVVDSFESDLRSLLKEVEAAQATGDYKEKLRVVDIFDEVSTKFGSFLNEKVIEFEIYKFGE